MHLATSKKLVHLSGTMSAMSAAAEVGGTTIPLRTASDVWSGRHGFLMGLD